MNKLFNIINSDDILFGIPGTTLTSVMIILLLTLICRKLFSHLIMAYLKKLVAKTENQLLRLRNFGKKSLDEVKTVLDRYGLKLGMDIQKIDDQLDTLKKIEEKK